MKKLNTFFLLSGALLLSAFALAQSPSTIYQNGTVNAADYSRAFAPGALILVFGTGFTATPASANGLPLPSSLAGVSLQITDGSNQFSAPLYFVSPNQINAQLPYNLTGPAIRIQVRTASGLSNADQVQLSSTAPRLFTQTADGQGRAVLTHADYSLVSRASPVKPGERVLLYANSLGAVTPAATAGAAPGNGSSGNPVNKVTAVTSALIDAKPAAVDFAGLAPSLPGVYQMNILTPYDNTAGDVSISVGADTAQSQAGITIPVEPNGFYWVLPASKFVNGQTQNGLSGSGSALGFRHNDLQSWGPAGLNAWTTNTGAGSVFAAVSGVALTLMNGSTIVYDNNGIENGTTNNFYNNAAGPPDAQKAGLFVFFSMSNYLDDLWAGYFRLSQPTTFTKIVGYFDGLGQGELPFDAANIYNHYRMNIFSSANALPGRNSFTGDVFSSDSANGQFSYSDTGVSRVFQDGAKAPIYRLVYTLPAPMTLAAGEYWFGHDVSVPVEYTVSAHPAGVRTTLSLHSAGSVHHPAPVIPSSLIRSAR